MPKPIQIVALESRLDVFLTRADAMGEIYLQSHLGRYLAIITAGYFEKSVQTILAEYSRGRSSPEVLRFVETQLAWEGSINRDKLKRLLDRFNANFFERVEGSVDEPAKQAVDSIKSLRDQLAHGDDNGTGYAVVKEYHRGVRRYVMGMVAVLVPP